MYWFAPGSRNYHVSEASSEGSFRWLGWSADVLRRRTHLSGHWMRMPAERYQLSVNASFKSNVLEDSPSVLVRASIRNSHRAGIQDVVWR